MFRPAQIGLLLGLCSGAIAHLLTPPYFNLAEGKNITASATCGVDTEIPELYCKLVGANSDQDSEINLIQGQVHQILINFNLLNSLNFTLNIFKFYL